MNKFGCLSKDDGDTKHEVRHFHAVVVQRRLRNVQKSAMQVQELLFCQSRSKPIAFLLLSSSLLKLPINKRKGAITFSL